MSRYDAASVIDALRPFQRAAVLHATDRLYAPGATGRFLVADETGLGKSLVARGVVAKAVELLQDDDSVERIDVVYICSSTELANQNLRRLDITGHAGYASSTRLSLLARESARFRRAPVVGTKQLNLVAFTPGTSLDLDRSRDGHVDERALLFVLLRRLVPDFDRDDLVQVLRCRASTGRFESTAQWTKWMLRDGVDQDVLDRFAASLRGGLLERLMGLLEVQRATQDAWGSNGGVVLALVSELRQALAKASVRSLTPDLIILDEFQRFRHLLDPAGGPAAELAHALFDDPAARVLLLSATPYKPYTIGNADADDDHYRDFMATLDFLFDRNAEAMTQVREAFADYGAALIASDRGRGAAQQIRRLLLDVMSRTERPRPEVDHSDADLAGGVLRAESAARDLVDFTHLRRLGAEARQPITVEQWKSIPHFAHFLRSYAVGRRLTSAPDERLIDAAARARTLDPDAIRDFAVIDPANGRLRALAQQTVDADMWKLLWMPASLPYFVPDGPYADLDGTAISKRVVFSSWTATPTSIASLLSYRADRLAATTGGRIAEYSAEARKSISRRLNWGREARAERMSTMALFWPHPALAQEADPLRLHGVASDAREALSFEGAPTPEAWEAYFSRPGRAPAGADPHALFAAQADDDDESDGGSVPASAGLRAHLDVVQRTPQDGRTHELLPDLALHGPANVAWRALGRLRRPGDGTTEAGHWGAAISVAEGLRSLFNRVDTHVLLAAVYGTEQPYWQSILRYIADGNLQAVLDEYFYCLRSERAGQELTDDLLRKIAGDAVSALTVQQATYRAANPAAIHDDDQSIHFSTRFALRYGAAGDEVKSGARDEGVRRAFNSPFQPFVLASTSVGQEGIDFHWWSHIVVHWNLPPNPVDFEQREGRVDRYAGHAVRKNVAAAHRARVLDQQPDDPWAAAFELAAGDDNEFGEFSPWWVYPGPAKVRREVLEYPLSFDSDRYMRLRKSLALYRLALGQPAQADLVELLQSRGVDPAEVAPIDLSPPRRQGRRRDTVDVHDTADAERGDGRRARHDAEDSTQTE